MGELTKSLVGEFELDENVAVEAVVFDGPAEVDKLEGTVTETCGLVDAKVEDGELNPEGEDDDPVVLVVLAAVLVAGFPVRSVEVEATVLIGAPYP